MVQQLRYLFFRYSDSVVPHIDAEALVLLIRVDPDGSILSSRLDTAENRIFHQWLQRQLHDSRFVEYLLPDVDLQIKHFHIFQLLDGYVIADKIQFLSQSNALVHSLCHIFKQL